MPTSSYDVYMVDTPKENDDEEQKDAAKDRSLEKPNPASVEIAII